MPHLLAIAIALSFAALEAAEISRRNRQRDYRNLPHAWLTVARACCFIFIILLSASPWLTAIPMMALFAIVHRPFLNIFRGMPLWWMGGDERTNDDSLYDTFWHWLTCHYTYTAYDHEGHPYQVYEQRHQSTPFVAATVFEVLVFVAFL